MVDSTCRLVKSNHHLRNIVTFDSAAHVESQQIPLHWRLHVTPAVNG